MIAVLISPETIETQYTESPDPNTHVVIGQPQQNMFEVVKEGIAVQQMLKHIVKMKEAIMIDEGMNLVTVSPVVVCLSPKKKATLQPLFEKLCPQFEKNLIYFKVGSKRHQGLPFNRAVLQGNQIAYGQGCAQLRPKLELRMALNAAIAPHKVIKYVVIQKSSVQATLLAKEGIKTILSTFDIAQYDALLAQTDNELKQCVKQNVMSEQWEEVIKQNASSQGYLIELSKIHKQVPLKQILPFSAAVLTSRQLTSQLFTPISQYNISPKSWVPHPSRSISAYIFHNLTDNRLYLSKAQKPKELENQQDHQKRVIAYHLSHMLWPQGLVVPQDYQVTPIKYSKIKDYENKKGFQQVRPYLPEVCLIEQICCKQQIEEIFKEGTLKSSRVKGIGAALCVSFLLNENFEGKTFSSQTGLVGKEFGNNLSIISSNSVNHDELTIFRTDFYEVLNLSDYKITNWRINITPSLKIGWNELSKSHLQEAAEFLSEPQEAQLAMVSAMLRYYRWSGPTQSIYDCIAFRMRALRHHISELLPNLIHGLKSKVKERHPVLSSLMLTFEFTPFVAPPKYHFIEQGKTQESQYLRLMRGSSSFVIQYCGFPIYSFLGWIRACQPNALIEYISLLRFSFQEYLVLDKKLKLTAANEKRRVILVVDHAECHPDIVSKIKGIKTIMIGRLKRLPEVEGTTVIWGQNDKKERATQSQDEIIRALYNQGLNFIDSVEGYQLHLWTLQAYIRVKCELYGLNEQAALSFLPTLHQIIIRNQHRLNEIDIKHPNEASLLHAFPLIKVNNKVVFNDGFYQILHLKNLLDSLQSGRWTRRLDSHQNASLAAWQPYLGQTIIRHIGKLLHKQLRIIEGLNVEAWQKRSQFDDCLQVFRSLTQSPLTKEKHQLWYSVFCTCQWVEYFEDVRKVLSHPNRALVLSADKITAVSGSFGNKAKTACFFQGQYLAVSCDRQRAHILTAIGSNSLRLCTYSLTGFQTIQTHVIPSNSWCALTAENDQLNYQMNVNKDILTLVAWKGPHYCLMQHKLCAFFPPQTMKLVLPHPVKQSFFLVKQDYQSVRPYIVTDKGLFLISEGKAIEVASLEQYQVSTASLRITHSQNFVHLAYYERTSILILSLDKNTGETAFNRVQLPKPIKCLTIRESTMAVSWQGSDSLSIFRLSASLNELTAALQNTYYWVDTGCTSIHLQPKAAFLQGPGYLKKIILPQVE